MSCELGIQDVGNSASQTTGKRNHPGMAPRNGGRMRVNWYRSLVLILVLVVTLGLYIYSTGDAERADKVLEYGMEFLEEFDDTSTENKNHWMLKAPPQNDVAGGAQLSNNSVDDSLKQQTHDTSPTQDHRSTIEPPLDDLELQEMPEFQVVDTADEDKPLANNDNEHVDKPAVDVEHQASGSTQSNDLDIPDNKTIVDIDLASQLLEDSVAAELLEPEADASHTPGVIPCILHQSAPSEMLPASYVSLIATCLGYNTDWKYYFWRDRDKREFMRIQYPLHADWFFRRPRQQREELFRYFVLPKFGGMHLDLGMECLRPLTPLLANASLFVAQERPELANILRNVAHSADASAVAGAPGHELFSRILESLADLPTGPLDASVLLTAAFDALHGNCTLWDYRYLGGRSADDDGLAWQELCKEVLDSLSQGTTYGPGHKLHYRQLGCVQLRDQNWGQLANASEPDVAVAQRTHQATWDGRLADKLPLVNITEQLGPGKILHYN